MSKGKTTYQFSVADSAAAEQVIQSWLAANGFQLFQENGENYYKSGDMMVGYRFFEYSVNGNQVIVYAYLGSHDKPRELSDQLAGAIPITAYKNALAPLFSNLGNGSSAPINQMPSYNTSSTPISNNEFQQSINKRQTTFAEISFWVSILLLVTAFFGISMSVILVLVNYYLAIQGLKSNKRKKAIAAIVMSSLAVVVIIVQVIIAAIK